MLAKLLSKLVVLASFQPTAWTGHSGSGPAFDAPTTTTTTTST